MGCQLLVVVPSPGPGGPSSLLRPLSVHDLVTIQLQHDGLSKLAVDASAAPDGTHLLQWSKHLLEVGASSRPKHGQPAETPLAVRHAERQCQGIRNEGHGAEFVVIYDIEDAVCGVRSPRVYAAWWQVLRPGAGESVALGSVAKSMPWHADGEHTDRVIEDLERG